MKRTGKMRYAHITGVLLVVFGPLLGPFLLLIDGYLISVTDSPYLAAFGRNRDHFFFTFTVPATISLAATTILLDFMFWTILQVIGGLSLLQVSIVVYGPANCLSHIAENQVRDWQS
jgi:hypothetical protein